MNSRSPAVSVACTKRAEPAGGEKCSFLDRTKQFFAVISANVRVQSATEWTASVHTLHMSKPVM